jgi:hypothetical protein
LPAPPLLGFVIVYTPENGDRLPACCERLEPDSIALQQETHCRFFFPGRVTPVGRSRLKCSFEADRLPLARQGHLEPTESEMVMSRFWPLTSLGSAFLA